MPLVGPSAPVQGVRPEPVQVPTGEACAAIRSSSASTTRTAPSPLPLSSTLTLLAGARRAKPKLRHIEADHTYPATMLSVGGREAGGSLRLATLRGRRTGICAHYAAVAPQRASSVRSGAQIHEAISMSRRLIMFKMTNVILVDTGKELWLPR